MLVTLLYFTLYLLFIFKVMGGFMGRENLFERKQHENIVFFLYK